MPTEIISRPNLVLLSQPNLVTISASVNNTIINTKQPIVNIVARGIAGQAGEAGAGVATGGTTGQILAKNSNTNYDTGWIDALSASLADGQIGFGSSANEITSSADFTYNATTKQATIEGLAETTTTSDVSATSISLVNTGNGYNCEGYTYNFKIYAYKSVGGSKVYSDTGFYVSQYLDLGETYREFLFTITPVSGANGYVLVRSINESESNPAANTYQYYKDIGSSTSYQDDATGYSNAGIEYNPTPKSLEFYNAPLALNEDVDYTAGTFDVLTFGQGLKFQWQSANDYLTLLDENDALQTIRANIQATTLTATTATLTSFSGAMTSGTISSSILKPVQGITFNTFDPVVISSPYNEDIRYVNNNALKVNSSRATVVINGGAEIAQTVSGCNLSITAGTNYAALAMKAAGTSGVHFFQIIDTSNILRAAFRGDGSAIFGSTNYSNYGRATFIDDGFAGNPASGQLSSLAIYAQDDANVYGWGVANRTYDINWQKVDVVCQALNTGGGWIGTLEQKPIDIRVNKTQKAFEADSAASATKIGFYGATTITKPTVTGSRGGNAALASLCTALANLGLITNSTS